MEASKQQFMCANPEKSEKARRRMQEIMMREESKLDFDRHKAHPLPTSILVGTSFIYLEYLSGSEFSTDF